LADFNASSPEFITKTPIATIWKVQSPHGPAALKLYHKPDMATERHGFTLMAALNGQGAPKVYKTTQKAALTEWLSGPI
jgi:streptomycin 6-kinase